MAKDKVSKEDPKQKKVSPEVKVGSVKERRAIRQAEKREREAPFSSVEPG